MQKWIDFKKKKRKYNRILQDLKKIIQDLQKYGQKGRLVKSLFDVIKKLFYDKSWVFLKESTLHRSPCAEMGGNERKWGMWGAY
jgi:hypothetical protein